MTNTLINSKSPGLKQSNSDETGASLRILVFRMGDVKLALPLETVSKILHKTAVYGMGLDGVGIAHIGDREVTVVDLHQQLFQASTINESFQAAYLVISQSRQGELYGIPVTAVPVLMEVPSSSIRVLPMSYRRADILKSATHVCHIPQAEAPLTIFMVDVDLLIPGS